MSLRSFASTFDYHIPHWQFMFHGYCCIFMSFFLNHFLKKKNKKNNAKTKTKATDCGALWTAFTHELRLLLSPPPLSRHPDARAPAPWVYGRPSTSWIVSQQDRASNWQQIIPKGEFVITSHNEILQQRGLVWEAPALQSPVNEMPQNALKYVLFGTSLTA